MMLHTAVGCDDISPPAHTWFDRQGDVITAGCNNNNHAWKLTCLGTKWIGAVGNCTQEVKGNSKPCYFAFV